MQNSTTGHNPHGLQKHIITPARLLNTNRRQDHFIVTAMEIVNSFKQSNSTSFIFNHIQSYRTVRFKPCIMRLHFIYSANPIFIHISLMLSVISGLWLHKSICIINLTGRKRKAFTQST